MVEISSDKAGRLARILHAAGETLAVDTPIGILALPGEDDGVAVSSVSIGAGALDAQPASPAVMAGTDRSDGAEPSAKTATHRIFASPLARRLASENGIDLAVLTGRGPRGRIMRDDILAHVGGAHVGGAHVGGTRVEGNGTGAAAATDIAPPPAAASPGFAAGAPHDSIPHSQMRRTIARRLAASKQSVPHFYLSADCKMDALIALRQEINAARHADARISVNDMVVKAAACALATLPACNVSWTEAGMLKHKHSDVGVAVAMPGGLITPIIRRAEQKSLSAISNEMKDLAARARNRKLKPEEYQGGTTAVSNLGMFGVKDFAAVINPPHATILAVGAGEQRAVVKDGAVEVATVMSVTLSTDHRAVDGALGAELLAAFRTLIENPMAMLV